MSDAAEIVVDVEVDVAVVVAIVVVVVTAKEVVVVLVVSPSTLPFSLEVKVVHCSNCGNSGSVSLL